MSDKATQCSYCGAWSDTYGHADGCVYRKKTAGPQSKGDEPKLELKQGGTDKITLSDREVMKLKEFRREFPDVKVDDPEMDRQTRPPFQIVTPIPPEVEQYASEIARFVEAMVYKLGVHSKKGKWENQTMESRLPFLDGEVAELREAIRRGNMVEVMLEAADVANYALIISAKAMEK